MDTSRIRYPRQPRESISEWMSLGLDNPDLRKPGATSDSPARGPAGDGWAAGSEPRPSFPRYRNQAFAQPISGIPQL